jgi:hypothetical protein
MRVSKKKTKKTAKKTTKKKTTSKSKPKMKMKPAGKKATRKRAITAKTKLSKTQSRRNTRDVSDFEQSSDSPETTPRTPKTPDDIYQPSVPLQDPRPVNPEVMLDPAHSPGHRKMSRKGSGSETYGGKIIAHSQAASKRFTRAERVQRNETPQRSTRRS